MNTTNSINATSLKQDISSVLSLIYHNRQTVLVERYGKIIAKMIPYEHEESDLELIADAVIGKSVNGKNSLKNAALQQHNSRKNEDKHRSLLSS